MGRVAAKFGIFNNSYPEGEFVPISYHRTYEKALQVQRRWYAPTFIAVSKDKGKTWEEVPGTRT